MNKDACLKIKVSIYFYHDSVLLMTLFSEYNNINSYATFMGITVIKC